MMLKNKAMKSPDYKWVSGSRLYGMASKTSDWDIRGFIVPPFEYLIGVKQFKSIECDGDDHKIYNLQHFLKLALKGDPQITEGFFAPADNVLAISTVGKAIMGLKDSLISNAIFGRIMGYSTGEWRKAMAIKIVSKRWKKEKYEVINDIRNLWHPKKEAMDSIIEILEDLDEKNIISSQAGLGVKRKADVEKYGFCRKSAAHAIRLVKQVTELMLTGKMTFPNPDATMLLDIRNGKYTKEDLEALHKNVVETAEAARKKSVLPDKPDRKKVWGVYQDIVLDLIVNYGGE